MRSHTLALIVALTIAACLFSGCSREKRAVKGTNYKFTFIIYGTAGNPFWTKVVNGAKEAAETLCCTVDIQFADNDAVRVNDILETSIASKTDGIAVSLNYDDAYDKSVQNAIDAGIPVIAFNIDDSKRARGNARMAYIGQDMETAGYIIASRLIEEAKLKKGDYVACPVEHPEAVYAVQRYAGAKKAFDEVGIKSDVVNTGGLSLEDTLNKLTQHLLGHKDTDAVLAMGGMPMEVAPQAIKEAGLSMPNAGFDLTKQIAKNLLDGKSLATVDQQPFYQGYLTITQLYYDRKYGLHPCDVNTGGGVVDKSTAKRIMDLADTVR